MQTPSICQKTHCSLCCQNTNMVLSKEDIVRIIECGNSQEDFCIQDEEGWIRLLNSNGRCVFHTGEKCSIYSQRPLGCRLYPIVFDLDLEEPIYDEECPHPQHFKMDDATIQLLVSHVITLIKEREKRMKK